MLILLERLCTQNNIIIIKQEKHSHIMVLTDSNNFSVDFVRNTHFAEAYIFKFSRFLYIEVSLHS